MMQQFASVEKLFICTSAHEVFYKHAHCNLPTLTAIYDNIQLTGRYVGESTRGGGFSSKVAESKNFSDKVAERVDVSDEALALAQSAKRKTRALAKQKAFCALAQGDGH